MPSFPDKGDFRDYGFPALLLSMWREAFKGVLDLRQGSKRKQIYFLDGEPAHVVSNIPEEDLGAWLRLHRTVPEHDLARAEAVAKESGGQLARSLVDLDVLSPNQIYTLVRQQVKERVSECMSWETGEFSLHRQPVDDRLSCYRIPLAELVVQGITFLPREKIQSDALRLDALHLRKHPSFERLSRSINLPSSMGPILAGLDGTRPLKELIAGAGEQKDAIQRALLICYYSGAVEEEATAPVQTAAPGPAADEAMDPAVLEWELRERYAQLKARNHFETLGVSRQASTADVKKAYFQLAKRFHPDVVEGIGLLHLKAMADEVFTAVAQASEVLGDEERRKEYLQTMDMKPEDIVRAQKILQAELEFQKGEILLKSRSYAKAVEQFQIALNLNPDEPEHHAYLGWSIFMHTPAERDRAIAVLEQSTRMGRKSDRSYYFMGSIYRAAGDYENAEKCLEEALRLNPDAEDAQRELRVVAMRREKDKGKPGFFKFRKS